MEGYTYAYFSMHKIFHDPIQLILVAAFFFMAGFYLRVGEVEAGLLYSLIGSIGGLTYWLEWRRKERDL